MQTNCMEDANGRNKKYLWCFCRGLFCKFGCFKYRGMQC